MDSHPTLTLSVYIVAGVVFGLVILYWILYTRRLRVPRNVGTNEGIAIPTQEKERTGREGSL